MKALTLILIAGLLGTMLLASMGRAAPGGAQNFTIGDMRVQTLKGYTYTYLSKQTTLKKIKETVGELMPKLVGAIDSGRIHPAGPVIFTYHGVTGQQDKPFTLDIGIMNKEGATNPDGFTTDKVAAEQCATVIYSGTVDNIGQAYGKLFGQLGQKGLQATDVTREVYLYWEDDNSENNIMQVQAVLSASGM
jgi:predicted transcriptional regulator YdeE